MKKILLLFFVVIFASLTSWAKYVYLYSDPREASTVYVGTDSNLGYFSNGFTFADVNPGETVYFAFLVDDNSDIIKIDRLNQTAYYPLKVLKRMLNLLCVWLLVWFDN